MGGTTGRRGAREEMEMGARLCGARAQAEGTVWVWADGVGGAGLAWPGEWRAMRRSSPAVLYLLSRGRVEHKYGYRLHDTRALDTVYLVLDANSVS